jgi:hypothetical protein
VMSGAPVLALGFGLAARLGSRISGSLRRHDPDQEYTEQV